MLRFAAAAALALSIAGCETPEQTRSTVTGAGAGAVVGGVAGAIIGGDVRSAAVGAAAGAAAGAVLGAVAGRPGYCRYADGRGGEYVARCP